MGARAQQSVRWNDVELCPDHSESLVDFGAERERIVDRSDQFTIWARPCWLRLMWKLRQLSQT